VFRLCNCQWLLLPALHWPIRIVWMAQSR